MNVGGRRISHESASKDSKSPMYSRKDAKKTKESQAIKKKKQKNTNYINLMPYEPDFRNMPIPEEIEPPVVKYEPINRSEIMKENRLLERSNTSSNLQKFSPRPFLVSDSSFSVLPNEDKSESLYKYNYENELWNKDDSKDLKMFNYHFGYKPPIMNKRADPNLSVSQSEDLEMQRYNPHSGSVEKYTIPKALPDSFDLPRINKSMHTFEIKPSQQNHLINNKKEK